MNRHRWWILAFVVAITVWGTVIASPPHQTPVPADSKKQEPDADPPVAAFQDDQGSEKYGFINRRGAVVLAPKYDWAGDFVNGLAPVKLTGRLSFIDSKGAIPFTLPADTRMAFGPSEGLTWFSLGNDRWGLCNDRAEIVLAPKYSGVEAFSEGLAAVNLGAKRQNGLWRGGKWGYIDKKGQPVIAIQYASAGSFSDGLALVRDREGPKFLDRFGKVIIPVKLEAGEVYSVERFREGLAPVCTAQRGKTSLTRYLDREGRTVFQINGYGSTFSEGLAVISVETGPKRDDLSCGYIDHKGKIVVEPTFARAFAFSDGLAAVQIKQKGSPQDKNASWGFVDKTGAFRIQPQFSEVRPFFGGVARVHVGGTFVRVNDAPSFWDGGEWWLIDTSGKKLRHAWPTGDRPILPEGGGFQAPPQR